MGRLTRREQELRKPNAKGADLRHDRVPEHRANPDAGDVAAWGNDWIDARACDQLDLPAIAGDRSIVTDRRQIVDLVAADVARLVRRVGVQRKALIGPLLRAI